jgi:hypothetical protein
VLLPNAMSSWPRRPARIDAPAVAVLDVAVLDVLAGLRMAAALRLNACRSMTHQARAALPYEDITQCPNFNARITAGRGSAARAESPGDLYFTGCCAPPWQ